MLVFPLHGRRLEMPLVLKLSFPLGRPRIDSASAPVVAHAIHGNVSDDRAIHIGVVNHRCVHVHYRRVVPKCSMLPAPADETDAGVAKSIINSAVEAHVRSPISGVPDVPAAAPSPVTRRPKKTNLWRHHPGSRHPVVSIGSVCPITWRPKIAWTGADGLLVYRQRRRADVYSNANADLRRRHCGARQHQIREHEQTN